MSTTFGLFKFQPKLDGHGELSEDDNDIPFIECAFRSNVIRWKNNFEIISLYLPDETPVYPLDNSPQGIYTIGDIKNKMKNENMV